LVIGELKQKILDFIKEMSGTETGPDNFTVEEPREESFGDLSTNAAMVLAPLLKKNPLDIAKLLEQKISSGCPEVYGINVVKPGFINFNLTDDFIRGALKEIIEEKENFGFNQSGTGIKVHMEYVSSNPTGRLHIGHGRWGALGDSLANIYSANGYEVFREYYVNDYGTQAEKFSECASCLYLKHFGRDIPYPEDGYPENTVSMAVDRLIKEHNDFFIIEKNGQKEVDKESFRNEIIKIMISYISETLALMGVKYDGWFYESSLYENSNFEKVVEELKNKGVIYNKDGAMWFKASLFVEDKDRVVIRKDGNPTYFASDILYLKDKLKRGYDRILYILGADHHGYVDRLKAIVRALGLPEEKITVIIGQLVKIVDGRQTLKMSRRKGRVYTLMDLIKEVGKDAVRYFFSMNSFDTPMDFDINLAKQKSNQNPVFYVQYAHARIESIIERADREKLKSPGFESFSIGKEDILKMQFKNDSERKLAKTMILYPDMVYSSCMNNAPNIITRYLYRLAAQFHYFYNNFRVIDDSNGEMVVNKDRFILIILIKQILQNALRLLEVSAPEEM
jgi:arginyl-tRNA synthetase